MSEVVDTDSQALHHLLMKRVSTGTGSAVK